MMSKRRHDDEIKSSVCDNILLVYTRRDTEKLADEALKFFLHLEEVSV